MTNTRIALIPAYKPGEELSRTVKQLKEEHFEIVVVNDGSGEKYEPVFHPISTIADIIVHPVNQGKGEALKTGMKYISEHFITPYTVVTVDADGQHKLNDILKVCKASELMPGALILGSRKFDKNVPLRSHFGNTVTRMVYRTISGVKLYDTQTGLRAFSDRLLSEMIQIDGSRYEYEMNVLMEMPRRGVAIQEIWIETVYLDGNSSSHFQTVRDSCRIYKEIMKYSASSFISFLVDYGLFCLLSVLTGYAVFSNIAARVCSSVLNYSLNKKYVFCSNQKVATSAAKYFILVAVVLLCNTVLLKALTIIGMNPYIGKILTELLLFAFSYIIQHKFVFGKERALA